MEGEGRSIFTTTASVCAAAAKKRKNDNNDKNNIDTTTTTTATEINIERRILPVAAAVAAAARATVTKVKDDSGSGRQRHKAKRVAKKVAAAAVSPSFALRPTRGCRGLMKQRLVQRLKENDPELIELKLYGDPLQYYHYRSSSATSRPLDYGYYNSEEEETEFAQFLKALHNNTTVSSVEINWRFLGSLPQNRKSDLLDYGVGSMVSLQELHLEGVGPCTALIGALRKSKNTLRALRVGSLRIETLGEVSDLAAAIHSHPSLQKVSLSNILIRTSWREDFTELIQQQQHQQQRLPRLRAALVLDPILVALSDVPTLKHIQLQLGINVTDRFERIQNETIAKLATGGAQCTHLMLSACHLDDDHCRVLARVLSSSSSSLETLVVTHNHRICPKG